MTFQKQSLSLEQARRAVDAVLAALRADDRPVAVTAADENGDTVFAVRMDGAGPMDAHQAARKAYTAAFIGRDTGRFREELANDGRTVADWADPMVTTLLGGVTVRSGGQVAGGIGVSGNGEARDDELAREGLAAISD